MAHLLVVRRLAKKDLREACDWYNRQSPELRAEFLAAADEVFTRIQQSPEHYAPIYKQVRHAQFKRFPYVAYFVWESARIRVIAVLHDRRDPEVWKSRE
jgi:plasmid stabilization system protein ParE